jgi:uncharacterized protein (DUF927 family)
MTILTQKEKFMTEEMDLHTTLQHKTKTVILTRQFRLPTYNGNRDDD